MRRVELLLIAFAVASSSVSAAAQGAKTRRVNVASNAQQANAQSDIAALARGGTCVAFRSGAWNLVAGDTNGTWDVFVHDLGSSATTRESVDSNGVQCDGSSGHSGLGISADGRFVVFSSTSPALVIGDTNALDDVFLRDRLLGTTIRVSVTSASQESTGASWDPSVSDDGRYVAFVSIATNLVTPDANGNLRDVFVRDVVAGTTTLVSVNAQGVQGNLGSQEPSISGDGRSIAFTSDSPNMVPLAAHPAQVFVRDLLLGTTSIESVSSLGVVGNDFSLSPFLSTDGRFLVFQSAAKNLVSGALIGTTDGFLRDRATGTTHHVTVGYGGVDSNGLCATVSVTDSGRIVLFNGDATNILPYSDYPNPVNLTWMRKVVSGDNVPVAVTVNGIPVGAAAHGLSSDGRVALFSSWATDVVPGDTNGTMDFFVRIAPFETPIFFCTPKVNSLGCTPQIRRTGISSASQTSGFQISATSLLNQRPGLLLYSDSGRAALPFGGGTLCLALVHRNTPGLNAGGSAAPANDCSGSYSLDMNAFAQGLLGGPPLPSLSIPGTQVQCQWWSRDPGFAAPNSLGLTGGIEYTVGS